MELILTTKQQNRARRDQQIAANFDALRKHNPTASAAAIIRTIAATGKFKLSPIGNQKVLERQGVLPENRKS